MGRRRYWGGSLLVLRPGWYDTCKKVDRQAILARKTLTLCSVCAPRLSPKAKASAKVWVGEAYLGAVRRTRIAREKGTQCGVDVHLAPAIRAHGVRKGCVRGVGGGKHNTLGFFPL